MSDAEDGAVIESWDQLNKAELVEECKTRGLPTGGGKQQLATRLENYDRENPDQDDLPFPDEGEQEDAPDGPELAGDETGAGDPPPNPYDPPDDDDGPDKGLDPAATDPDPAEIPSGNTFQAEFDLPAGFDLLHEDLDLSWKLQARDLAIEAGHTPLGGAYAAHNVRYGSRDGKTTIIYNVPIKMG
jgi:hypothetical protein